MKKTLLLMTAMSFLSFPQVSYAGLFEDLGVTRVTKAYNSSNSAVLIRIYSGTTELERAIARRPAGSSGRDWSIYPAINEAIDDLYEANGYGAAPDYAYADAAAAIAGAGSTTATPTLAQLNAAPDGATATFNGHTWVKTPQTIGATTIRRWIRAGGNVLTNANREQLRNLVIPATSRYSPTPDMTTSDGNINYTVVKPGAYLTHDGKPVQSFRVTVTNRQTGVTTTHTYTATGTQNSLGAHNYTDSATNTVSGIPSLPANAANIVYATDIVEVPTDVSIDIPDADIPAVTKTNYVSGEWALGAKEFDPANFADGTTLSICLNDNCATLGDTYTKITNGAVTHWRHSSGTTHGRLPVPERAKITQPENVNSIYPSSWTITVPPATIRGTTTGSSANDPNYYFRVDRNIHPTGTRIVLRNGGSWITDNGVRYNEYRVIGNSFQAVNYDGTDIPNERYSAIRFQYNPVDVIYPWGAYNTNANGIILSTHRDPNGAFRGTPAPSEDNYHIDRDNSIASNPVRWEGLKSLLLDSQNRRNGVRYVPYAYNIVMEGIQDAYRDGFEDGWESGWVDGYETGYSDGYSDGYADGFADGRETN